MARADTGGEPGARIAVVYLARQAEGKPPLARFARSYLDYPADISHDLVIVYKGYTDPVELAAAREVFEFAPHIAIEIPDDVGFDIGAYLAAAHRLDHDYVCCLNTFTEILDTGWLRKLYLNAAKPDVGIVGATASYESLLSSVAVLHKVNWLCNTVQIKYDEALAHYFDFWVDRHCRPWKAEKRGLAVMRARRHTLPKRISRHIRRLKQHRRYEKWWANALKTDLAVFGEYPPFPNPHVRSNGFMTRRKYLVELAFRPITIKTDACYFESGHESLTTRLRRAGLRALVVGRDGIGYDVPDWPRSGTFRLGNQENLLLSDNQTRGFAAMSSGAKATHVRMTWGDYLQPAPRDFPQLCLEFPTNWAVTGRPSRASGDYFRHLIQRAPQLLLARR